jgi:hypothetical protein
MLSAPEAAAAAIAIAILQPLLATAFFLSFFCWLLQQHSAMPFWSSYCKKTILMGEHLHPHCQPLNEKGEKWLLRE